MGRGNESLYENGPPHKTKMAAMVKTFKNLILQYQKFDDLEIAGNIDD